MNTPHNLYQANKHKSPIPHLRPLPLLALHRGDGALGRVGLRRGEQREGKIREGVAQLLDGLV